MAKWKCEICGNEFENYHAQGFDNKIYCPLCYFKKKYENAVADYEKTEFEKEQLNSLVNSCQEEIRRLKKQLTTYQILHRDCKVDNLKNISKIEEMENQQKEFIDYINKIIEDCNNYSKYIEKKLQELKSRSVGKTFIANEIMKNEVSKKILKEILSKYQEIIGGKE